MVKSEKMVLLEDKPEVEFVGPRQANSTTHLSLADLRKGVGQRDVFGKFVDEWFWMKEDGSWRIVERGVVMGSFA